MSLASFLQEFTASDIYHVMGPKTVALVDLAAVAALGGIACLVFFLLPRRME
jgi:hypothetical protein